MLRRRKRPLPIASETSDDSSSQPRNQIRVSGKKSVTSINNIHHRSLERRDSYSSDNSFVPDTRKKFRKSISTSEEDSSSVYESEASAVQLRTIFSLNGSVKRDLIDQSSAKSSIQTRSGTFYSRNSTESSSENETSSDESLIRSRCVRKRKRQYNNISRTNSSDSGIHVGSRKIKKFPNNKECSSNSSFSNMHGSIVVEDINQPSTSRESSPTRNNFNRKQRGGFDREGNKFKRGGRIPLPQSEDEMSSDSDIIQRTLRHHKSVIFRREDEMSSDSDIKPKTLRHRKAIVLASEDEISSDSDIRPKILRHRRSVVFASDDTSSGSDNQTDGSLPVRNRVRQGGVLALRESDEELDSVEVYTRPLGVNARPDDTKTYSTSKSATMTKPSHGSSSDSDNESEKCPICLTKFSLQETGTPGCCNHSFCLDCIKKWAENNNTCPVDRLPFDKILVRDFIQGEITCQITVEKPFRDPLGLEVVLEDLFAEPRLSINVNVGEIYAVIGPRESFEDNIESDPDYFLSVSDSDGDGPDEVCCVCNQSDLSNNMIVCDNCNDVYHMECVNPPLRYIPVTYWMCPECNGERYDTE